MSERQNTTGEPSVCLNVNGRDRELACNSDANLLDVLRNELGLKATRFGCGEGLCGACLVLVDGRALPACDTPVWSVVGKTVITVEHLGNASQPHPIQTAFIEEQALQCGYCSSGMIIAAYDLLSRNPRPSDADIRQALYRNLCRCGVHNRIIRAVQRAAEMPSAS